MIEFQLRLRGISDPRVLSAMGSVPRDMFVPPRLRPEAYGDYPLPIGEGQTISQPYMVAWMTELLALAGNEKVLEIGTGSGYQTAILAELCRRVYTVERFDVLSAAAQRTISNLGYRNISFRIGDGTLGWEEQAPFDRILVTAASDRVPPPLFKQLATNGRMIIPLGERYSQQLSVVQKINGEMKISELGPCVFVPLIGRYGMQE